MCLYRWNLKIFSFVIQGYHSQGSQLDFIHKIYYDIIMNSLYILIAVCQEQEKT